MENGQKGAALTTSVPLILHSLSKTLLVLRPVCFSHLPWPIVAWEGESVADGQWRSSGSKGVKLTE